MCAPFFDQIKRINDLLGRNGLRNLLFNIHYQLIPKKFIFHSIAKTCFHNFHSRKSSFIFTSSCLLLLGLKIGCNLFSLAHIYRLNAKVEQIKRDDIRDCNFVTCMYSVYWAFWDRGRTTEQVCSVFRLQFKHLFFCFKLYYLYLICLFINY